MKEDGLGCSDWSSKVIAPTGEPVEEGELGPGGPFTLMCSHLPPHIADCVLKNPPGALDCCH